MKIGHLSAALAACTISAAALANGGTNCTNAATIASIPFTDTGFTCGMGADLNVGMCLSQAGPDVMYRYVPESDQIISIGLCEALGQARLYVCEGVCTHPIACGQMVCTNSLGQPTPRINSLQLLANHIYFIVVDSMNTAQCVTQFEIVIEEVFCKECPKGAAMENEENCGLAADGSALDFTNGGCASLTPAFTPLTPGVPVCGTISGDKRTGHRDTDWFEIHLSGPSQLTWSVSSEAYIVTAVPENGGVPDCSGLQCLSNIRFSELCAPSVTTVNRPAGDWWFLLMPWEGEVLSCDTSYTILATVNPISADLNDSGMVDGIDLAALLAAWSQTCPTQGFCPADLNVDGAVDGVDLGALLAAWGSV